MILLAGYITNSDSPSKNTINSLIPVAFVPLVSNKSLPRLFLCLNRPTVNFFFVYHFPNYRPPPPPSPSMFSFFFILHSFCLLWSNLLCHVWTMSKLIVVRFFPRDFRHFLNIKIARREIGMKMLKEKERIQHLRFSNNILFDVSLNTMLSSNY